MPDSSGVGLMLMGVAAVGFVYANGVHVSVPKDTPPAVRRVPTARSSTWLPPERDPFRRAGEPAAASGAPVQAATRDARPFPALSLTASFLGPSGRVALVNGVPLAPGEVLEGATLVEVHREEAVFRMDSRVRRITIAALGR